MRPEYLAQADHSEVQPELICGFELAFDGRDDGLTANMLAGSYAKIGKNGELLVKEDPEKITLMTKEQKAKCLRPDKTKMREIAADINGAIPEWEDEDEEVACQQKCLRIDEEKVKKKAAEIANAIPQ